MTEWLEYSAEWAYWINPKTFRMPRLKKNLPVGVILIEKHREASDEGRTFVSSLFSIVKEDGPKTLSKAEASKILAKQMLEYMKKNKMWTPYSEVKEEFKNGNVDVLFAPSDFDKFTVRFTPTMVGESVKQFLDVLSEFSEQVLWKIEPAKSSRSTCKTCYEKIGKGELRIGEPTFFQEHLTYVWHHLRCAKAIMPSVSPDELKGYDVLDDAQQKELKETL